ncbi:MAG TPA: hypothetical protein VE999_00935 [Gemmataceae bacterium]|nr:hypothetical protein [Gemmataceae bacterium]
MKQPAPILEQRIASTLANPAATASELSKLVAETELAAHAAEQDVARLREAATDLVAAPDAKAAFEAAELANLTRQRLANVLPKLRERYASADHAERFAAWRAAFQHLAPEHEAISDQINDTIQRFKNEWTELAERVALHNAEAEQVNNLARAIDEYNHFNHLHLPQLFDSATDQRKWGAPKVNGSFAASFAQSMIFPSGPGDRWSDPEVQAQRRAEIEKEQARLADYYTQQGKAQEERLNREEAERFKQ